MSKIANNNFFEDKSIEDQGTKEPEKVKVGDTEFTSDELQELIGAGQKLREIEGKQGQPVEKILESWGKRGERLGEWKKATGAQKPEEFLKVAKEKEEKPQEQVDEEKIREQVLAEAKKFGLATTEEVERVVKQIYNENRAGEKVLVSVNKVLRVAKADGKPTTTPEKLLEFMADPSNPKDPEKAYKLMFETELEDWKAQKLGQLKKENMPIEKTTTAGAKEFTPPKLTNRDELREALKVAIRGEGGGQ